MSAQRRPPRFNFRASAATLFARRAWWPTAIAHLDEPARVSALEHAYLRHFLGDRSYPDAVARVVEANNPTDPPGLRETLLISYIAQVEAGLVPGITPVAFDVPYV